MIRVIKLRKLTASILKCLAIAAPSVALLACGNDLLPGSKEVVVEAVASGSSLDALPNAHINDQIGPTKPLTLSFDESSYFVNDSSSWLYRGSILTYMPDQGHFKAGSVRVHNRSESWQGPALRLPMLETGTAYRASLWIKTGGTTQPTDAKLVLTRVANGINTSFVLGQIRTQANVWQKIEGEFLGTSQWSDDIAVLSVDLADANAEYLVDDVVVAHAEYSEELEAAALAAVTSGSKYFRNGDVEEGIEYWGHQGGVINRSSTYAHSGNYSLLITGRNQSWNAPTMVVRGLEDDRRYRISIYVRLNDGEPATDVQLTLRRTTNGQTSFNPIGGTQGSSTEWTEIFGYFSAPTVSQSEEVMVYLEARNPTASYFIDTLTIEEVPNEGFPGVN